MTDIVWLTLIAGGLTAGILKFLLSRGWAGRLALDTPNQRSLHASPIPRVGGLVLVPMALAVAGTFLQQPPLLLSLAGALCAISFADDRWGLPIAVRLASHALAVVVFCLSQGAALSPVAFAVAMVVLVWAINLFNFMDGADGLAAGMALTGFTACGWALLDALPALAHLSFSLAAAAAGFLVFNFSPARVFMGDAGSVPLGFLAGAVGFSGWLQGAWPAWFPLLVFSPFVADASVTLLKRVLRKERFWEAHRDHYYQRLVRMGWSHRRLALVGYVLMAACGGSALALLHARVEFQVAGLLAWVAAYAGLMMSIDGRWAHGTAGRGDLA